MKRRLFLLPAIGVLLTMGLFLTSCTVAAKPEGGKQVAMSIDLPASTSVWQRPAANPNQTPEERAESIRTRIALAQKLDMEKTQTVHYMLFLPADYDETANQEKTYPLLLFLHGAGERGNDVTKLGVHGPPKLVQDPQVAAKWPFITVSPQCHEGYYWSPAQLSLLLDAVEKQYRVDKTRIYVTGLSMGGFGSWLMAHHSPQRFAAVAPICGGFMEAAAPEMKDVPLWIFHGSADNVVSVTLSETMYTALQKAGATDVKLTIYPNVGHDAWTETYKNPALYEWFLQHTRK